MARRGQEEPGGRSQEGPRRARRGQEERGGEEEPGRARRSQEAPPGSFWAGSGVASGMVPGWSWSGTEMVLGGSLSSGGVQEGSHTTQEEPGGARKRPLAPAHQRNFDETYASRFLYSDTDEILPGGSWVVAGVVFGFRFSTSPTIPGLSGWAVVWTGCMQTGSIQMVFQCWPPPGQHA